MLATAFAGVALATSSTATAAVGDRSYWLPFRVGAPGIRVNCTYSNGCAGGYHSVAGHRLQRWLWHPDLCRRQRHVDWLRRLRSERVDRSTAAPTTSGTQSESKHPNGLFSWNGHLSSIARGDGSVAAGDLIGYSGNSGKSYGAHLHYEVRSAQ